MKKIKNVEVDELGLHERLQIELSTYPEKTVYEDGSVSIKQIKTPYFLVNDNWNINFVVKIKQFEKFMEKYKNSKLNIHFKFSNPLLNLEVKYVFYKHLFNDLWLLTSIFTHYKYQLNKITDFLNEKYPKLSSLLELDIDKAEREFLFWLNNKGINTLQKNSTYKTPTAKFLRNIYTLFFKYIDRREEWEKDRWDVRVLHDKYGIYFNKSLPQYYLDFSSIDWKVRKQVKKYFKQRLVSKNNFSTGTEQNYLKHIPGFF